MTANLADAAATKAALRASLRERRRGFVEATGRAGDLLVANLFVADAVRPLLARAKVVAGYVSDGLEVDPLPVMLQAIDLGLATVLPRVAGRDQPMTFHHWLPGDPLVRGPLGLHQPVAEAAELAPDLILAPLVGFDAAFNRLGQGGAFYDRAFAALPEARRIGLAWSCQQVDAIPAEAWDVPLHDIATERGLIGSR